MSGNSSVGRVGIEHVGLVPGPVRGVVTAESPVCDREVR